MKRLAVLILFIVGAWILFAQEQRGLPALVPQVADCVDGQILKYRITTKDFGCVSPPSPGGIPSGSILIISSGTCPTGFSEATELDGVMLRGTLTAHGDIGGTGGADSITPTVNSLTAAAQTVNSLIAAAHTHSWPAGVPTNGAIAIGTFANVATATTGNCAATNTLIGTGAANSCKATAPNLTVPAEGHTGALTPPVISWPAGVPTEGTSAVTGTMNSSAVTGTLNSFDNRPAFKKVIFCKAN